MLPFFNAARVNKIFGLLVLYLLVCDANHIFKKKVGEEEYVGRVSFSTFPSDKLVSLVCSDIQFECKNDTACVPLESYCDGKIDCADESDELMCAKPPAIYFLDEKKNTPPPSSPSSSQKMNASHASAALFIMCASVLLLK